MKSLLTSLLLFVSLASFGQGPVTSDMSDASRPRQNGEFNLRQQGGQIFLLPKTGPAIPQVIDAGNVAGLNALFSGYYSRRIVDSINARKADVGSVYDRTTADQRFKPIGYQNTIDNTPGLKDSLQNRVTRAEYQAAVSQAASTTNTYTIQQANTIFQTQQTSLAGYNISDAYTKPQTDAKIRFVNAREFAAANGYLLPGDGSDQTAALQYVLNNVTGTGAALYLPAGKYVITRPLVSKAGIIITGTFATVLAAGADFGSVLYAGNDATCMLQPMSNTTVEYLNVDIQGHNCGGIYSIGTDNVTVQYCSVSNWRGPGQGRFGIAMIGATRNRILFNALFNGDHGVHGYDTDISSAIGNSINGMTGGGLYTGWSNRFTATGNFISNCADVGLDFEGGTYCYGSGNTITRCRNGEQAIFSGNNEKSYVSHHLIQENNVSSHGQYYTAWTTDGSSSNQLTCSDIFGALNFMSLDEGCYETGFAGGSATSTWGPVLYHAGIGDKSNRRVFVRDMYWESSTYFLRILASDGMTISGNTWRGLAGSETSTNEMRDCHNLLISRNDVRFDNPKTSGYVFFINTSNTFATIGATVEYNTFTNVGAFGSQYDPFNNTNLVATYRTNDFGRFFTSNGGLSVTDNGMVKLYNQQLRFALVDGGNDMSAVQAIKRLNGAAMATGTLGQGRDGFNGSLYTSQLLKGNGNIQPAITSVINAGGSGQTLLTASVSGSTITLNNTTGAATGGRLTWTFDSYN